MLRRAILAGVPAEAHRVCVVVYDVSLLYMLVLVPLLAMFLIAFSVSCRTDEAGACVRYTTIV